MMKVIILDNKNLEDKLTVGKQYEVKGESVGDFHDYYLLLCDDGKQHWVEKYRVALGSDVIKFEIPIHTIDLPSMLKSTVQRIICIPDENGHVVDLQRIQYISPIDKGSYKVTLVSGWEMPLTDEVYSREKLVGQWKGLQNK
jgi:hypothetical protein